MSETNLGPVQSTVFSRGIIEEAEAIILRYASSNKHVKRMAAMIVMMSYVISTETLVEVNRVSRELVERDKSC